MPQQKQVQIKAVNNGYGVTFEGFVRNNGPYVFKHTEEFKMLEQIGEMILGKKVEVKDK